ncbi:hypothetical protein GCM10010124_32920 [Pilimelia terevasa]|uniref:Prepilin-type N-terminal cleavage/methylation domain-containing protein n=1 Tax=Pilimelia terevasa TaxID=53372 RepID=A0A8J3BUL9_9ACTN|nr:prepilin-type N-terminal cleavage/methylation domain-containing protein [Pilimelia terevasa]GGK37548.1 hypothetical protein GCM10010124_32920 [Pilimelia terevasa]
MSSVRTRLVRRARSADGFTLVEAMVAAALVGVVMFPVTAFLARALRTTDAQGVLQEAGRVAGDSLDAVRALPVGELVRGRDAAGVAAQWAAAPAAARPALASMVAAVDPAAAAGAGVGARLPTVAVALPRVDGVTVRRQYFVGRCWQRTPSAACGTAVAGAEFVRVVVALTWSGVECPAAGCARLSATTRTAGTTDPVFHALAPAVAEPTAQGAAAGTAASVRLTAIAGAAVTRGTR